MSLVTEGRLEGRPFDSVKNLSGRQNQYVRIQQLLVCILESGDKYEQVSFYYAYLLDRTHEWNHKDLSISRAISPRIIRLDKSIVLKGQRLNFAFIVAPGPIHIAAPFCINWQRLFYKVWLGLLHNIKKGILLWTMMLQKGAGGHDHLISELYVTLFCFG